MASSFSAGRRKATGQPLGAVTMSRETREVRAVPHGTREFCVYDTLLVSTSLFPWRWETKFSTMSCGITFSALRGNTPTRRSETHPPAGCLAAADLKIFADRWKRKLTIHLKRQIDSKAWEPGPWEQAYTLKTLSATYNLQSRNAPEKLLSLANRSGSHLKYTSDLCKLMRLVA